MSDLPVWYLPVSFFLFGLCFGSFLNVVALRGLSGEDIVFIPSKCPKCQKSLKWYMNIPLLSYIFLRGKCGFCKTKISVQYPIIEFLTALSFVLIYLSFGFTVKTFFFCAFSFFFILLALTDILEMVIIDFHAYILTGLALIFAILGYSDISIVQALIGAVVGFGIFEILSLIGKFFANVRMFGEGDSYIALALGAIYGVKPLLIIVALSCVIQTITAIPVMVINSFREKKYKLGLTYIFIFISICLIAAINYFNLIENIKIYTVLVSVLSIFLIFCLKTIMNEVRLKAKLFNSEDSIDEILDKSKFHVMPFGPALIISGFICMFYLDNIKEIVRNFIF